VEGLHVAYLGLAGVLAPGAVQKYPQVYAFYNFEVRRFAGFGFLHFLLNAKHCIIEMFDCGRIHQFGALRSSPEKRFEGDVAETVFPGKFSSRDNFVSVGDDVYVTLP
jgi:hypothetical protein